MKNNRLHVIDGVRGWAALSVLLFHVFYEVFGIIAPAFRGSSFYFIFNGGLAVTVFFILSGDALSTGYFINKRVGTIDSLLLKRYFRLTGPIFLSCLIVYLLMKAGLTFNRDAGKIIHREDWLGSFIPFQPSIRSLFKYAFYQVYDGHSKLTSYNPFLWTMSIELIGSMLVFLFCYISERLEHPLKTLAIIITFLFATKSFYALFFIGVFFSYLRANNILAIAQNNKAWQMAVVIIIPILVLLDTKLRGFSQGHINILMSTVLVFCVYTSGVLSKFFSSRISRFLGAVSFPLYLVHFSVIASLTSYLILKYQATLDTSHIYFISIATISFSLLGAIFFYRIEILMLSYINRVPFFLLNGRREP